MSNKTLKVDRLHFLTQELYNLGVTEFEVKFKIAKTAPMKPISNRLDECGATTRLVEADTETYTYRLLEA